MGMEANVNVKEDLNIPVMLFCIIGVVLLVFGFMLMLKQNFKLMVFSAEGTVSTINTVRSADGSESAIFYNVEYVGAKGGYTAQVAKDDQELNIGDKLPLYYDFFTPTSVSLKRTGWLGYLAFAIGLILSIKTLPRFLRILRDNYIRV